MSPRRNSIRKFLMGATALASASWLAISPAAAQDIQQITFDLPVQPLGAALRHYARTAHEQVIFADLDVRGRTAPALIGKYSADQALQMLLADTGLKAERTSSGVLQVSAASDPQSGSAAGDGADGTVAALVVTAQKREENIQDVPIAMSAFTQEDLTRSQVAGGPDLMTQVPNFTFTKTNFSGYSIQIRGIGTQAISATTDAAVAVAFNNTPFIRNRFFEQEFYDLQRVEVLRGPQGTLYGRNATAGVVNIISAKPKFGYEAKLSADVANYKSTRLEGMVNLPIVEDKVAIRLAGAWTKRDGYDTNLLTGNQIDGRDLWSTRTSLRIAPTDNFEANLVWEHFQEDDDRLRSGKQLCHTDDRTEINGYIPPPHDGTQFVLDYNQGCLPESLYSPASFEIPNGFSLPYVGPLAPAGNLPINMDVNPYADTKQSRDLRVIESMVDPRYRAKTDTVELQLTGTFDKFSLTSETGYLRDSLFSMEDYNRFKASSGLFDQAFWDTRAPWSDYRAGLLSNGVFCDPQLGCADRLVAVDVSRAKSRQFSQEFRLESSLDGPINFSFGANFLRYDTMEKYYVFINTLTMFAAISNYAVQDPFHLPSWRPGVSDNHECMRLGLREPDPHRFQGMSWCHYVDPNPIENVNDLGHHYFLSKNPYKLISYAAFGEAYYQIAPDLKLTAGLRWTVDSKEAPRIPSWIIASQTAGYPTLETVRQEWREPTGRLTLDWKPDLSFTDETLLYGSFAHGYKAGGANPPPAGIVMWAANPDNKTDVTGTGTIAQAWVDQSATHPKTFKPEFVNAYEVGTKNTLLGGNLTLNGDAFYYDYKGYQISQIVDRSAINYNFDAKVWGLELEADWRPLENLRLGFKGGYENTRVADGMKAVDVMDRTAGHTDWLVVRPFPTFPSNCIVRADALSKSPPTLDIPEFYWGHVGPCEYAYVLNLDPLTLLPYTANPTEAAQVVGWPPYQPDWLQGYAGFDPLSAPNHGEGFYKDLSGHALPNAPHFTATVTADYTLPLRNEWLMTLHSDFYYQSEAWTRIFNTPGYDKLKAYTNVNFAAIFSNEDAGWKVMAYVKNVFDRDSITGAFLNSDDTGLTTNVFLTEPRLYGLRVTKEWTGNPWWTGSGARHAAGEPYPLTVQLGGAIQRQRAPFEGVAPDFADAFSPAIDPRTPQNRKLDRGDGREIRLTYQPGSLWRISAAYRYGRASSSLGRSHLAEHGETRCMFDINTPFGRESCDPDYVLVLYGQELDFYNPSRLKYATNRSDASAITREEHQIVDFSVGSNFPVGVPGSFELGLRAAEFDSSTDVTMRGIPDWQLPNGWYFNPAPHHIYDASLEAHRKFEGLGPFASWEPSVPLIGSEEAGRVELEVKLAGGVLFGKQKTSTSGMEGAGYFTDRYPEDRTAEYLAIVETPVKAKRTNSVSVPVLDLSLGFSYEIQCIKLSTGYHWERYYNVLDAGNAEHKSYDRTIDGTYFKIAIGFGG